MSIRIVRIKKPSGLNSNPHEAISEFDWIEDLTGKSGIASRQQIYDFLQNKGVAYVKDARGDVAYLYPKQNLYGTKFVQTYADGIWKDNLLALPTIT
jgi:hypothetical protein